MTDSLLALVSEARLQLGSDACKAGRHQWGSEGGRACPLDLTTTCSQTVYRCVVCGDWDYGERGGPGHNDCVNFCRHKTDKVSP